MKFLGMCFDAPEGYPYIILPFMANGSLLSYLKKKSAGTLGSNTSGYPDVSKEWVCEYIFTCRDSL